MNASITRQYYRDQVSSYRNDYAHNESLSNKVLSVVESLEGLDIPEDIVETYSSLRTVLGLS